MDIGQLQRDWEAFGARDPMWAVLTDGADEGRVWTPEEFFELGRRDVDEWMRRLEEVGGTRNRERALDFGCGVGRLSQALAAHFRHVVGVDISRPMLDAARKHNHAGNRVEYVHNTSLDLRRFPEAGFDLVLSHIVLQHLQPAIAKGYIAEFLRILRPGGAAIFQIPTERVGRRVRYAVIRTVPGLVTLYRRLRRGPSPHSEMHAVSRGALERILKRGHARVLAADPIIATGSEFRSTMFYVARDPV